jgi:hypothetical protein
VIYVIEIPHKGKPSVWTDDSLPALLNHHAPVIPPQFEEASQLDALVCFLRTHNHAVMVLKDDAAALHAYLTGEGLPPHQFGATSAALGRALRDAGVMTRNGLTADAEALALALWREQLAAGIGAAGDEASEEGLDDWLSNRAYNRARLIGAARGDVAALVEVRAEAGLPAFQ